MYCIQIGIPASEYTHYLNRSSELLKLLEREYLHVGKIILGLGRIHFQEGLEHLPCSAVIAVEDARRRRLVKDAGKKHPTELSGGEQQRVAIARALSKKPKVLFLDEPTGALDEKTGRSVLDYIIKLQEKEKFTMIMVTHNANIAETADRTIKMNSGKIVDVYDSINKKSAYEIGW